MLSWLKQHLQHSKTASDAAVSSADSGPAGTAAAMQHSQATDVATDATARVATARGDVSLPAPYAMVLNTFTDAALPQPLSALLLDVQYRAPAMAGQHQTADAAKHSEWLQLSLPIAAASMKPALFSALQHVGFAGELHLDYQDPAPRRHRTLRHIVLVASGKGGVGKSTTAVNVALALAQQGAKVGVLDADIYGPSIPTLLGLTGHKASSPDEKHIQPAEAFGLSVQSIGFLVDPANATVWRGPMASQALLQLLNETLWPELDILVVDMPPGTGDIQLTMAQKLPVSGAVIVTTPQDVALCDAQKAIHMFRQVNIPVLGLVENMSFYQCPACGHADHIFGCDGGSDLAQRHSVPVLAQLPLLADIRRRSDAGQPMALEQGHPVASLYQSIAIQLLNTLYYQTVQAPLATTTVVFTDD